jgi:prepilin-type N-terminal cleavage/methylation domain-containing protein
MNKGFSLIEVLVVVAIAASVVLVVGNFGNNITGLDSFISSDLQSKGSTNASLSIMTKDIQSAANSAGGGYPIDAASTSSFAFYSDIDKTGIMERVHYFYATSTIYRGIISPTGTPPTYPSSTEIVTDFIHNVIIASGTPLFSYYGSSYTGTQASLSYPLTISSIRLVGISFSVQLNQTSTNRSPLQYFSSLINLRNLNTN